MQGKMTTAEYLQFIDVTFGEMKELIRRKNADYTNGAGPFANFEAAEEIGLDPIKGLVMRLLDKVQRLKSFCKQGELQVKGEGVEDIFKDFIGYSLIALAMLQERTRTQPQQSVECLDERTGKVESWYAVADLRSTQGLPRAWPLQSTVSDPVYSIPFVPGTRVKD